MGGENGAQNGKEGGRFNYGRWRWGEGCGGAEGEAGGRGRRREEREDVGLGLGRVWVDVLRGERERC